MPRTYDLNGNNNPADPLNGDANTSLLGQIDDMVGNILFSNDDWSSSIIGELTGYNAQQREFAQQEYLMDKENAYNTPAKQMERMLAAGINPNTAAAAIAGKGSESASPAAVASNNGGAASALGSAASMLGSIGSVAQNFAEAKYKNETLNPTISNLEADTLQKLASKGLTEEQIFAWQVDNKYRDANAQQDLRIKALNEENLRQEWKVLESNYQSQMQAIDESIARISLMKTEEGVNNANKQYLEMLAQKTDLERQWQKIRVEFWKEHGYDIMASSTDAIFVQRLENGLSNKELITDLSLYYGQIANQQQNAIAENAYNIAYNQALAKMQVEWNARPGSIPAFVTWCANRFAKGLQNSHISQDEARKEIMAHNDFLKVYSEMKSDLNKEVKEAKKAYKDAKRHLGSSAVNEAWRRYQNALQVYEDFDEEEYANMIIQQISPR